jgi:hypothetical protein
MRTAKAIAILVIGPSLGILVGLIVGALALPPDPDFVASGGHASPGDGFLAIGAVLLSLLITTPVSIVVAAVVFFRKPRAED